MSESIQHSSDNDSRDARAWQFIVQFALHWTPESPSAEAYWREHAEFAGDLHALCELLAVEYRNLSRELNRDDHDGRQKLRERVEQQLRAESTDEALMSLLQAQLELVDDGGESEVAPPVVGTTVAAADTFQIRAIVEGTSEAGTANLGTGGFKSVRLANQKSLSRNVALKFPSGSMSVFHVDIEARILKRLSHQNIPPVHGYRQGDPDHGCYIVETYGLLHRSGLRSAGDG